MKVAQFIMVLALCVVAACAEDDPARHLPDAMDPDALVHVELAITRAGNGSGTVTSVPAGVSCGSTCTATFAQHTIVTLTAQPAEGSVFAGWSSACAGESTTCEVTLESAASVTATFALEKHRVTLVKAGQGTGGIHGDGVECTGTCTVEVDHGAMLSFTATPTGLSMFGGWGGACSGSGNCDVTVTTDIRIQANFVLDNFTLSVNTNGTGTGTVSSNPAGLSCSTSCQHTFTANQMVTLTAAAATGSTFTGWSGGGCTGSGSCVVTMDGSKTATATFTLNKYTLDVMTNGTGGGTVASTTAGIDCGTDCTQDYDYGSSIVLTATPTTGSVFGSWGGACSGTATTCTVAITSAKSVTATFTLTSQTLTVTKSGLGTITSTPAGISCGATCTAGFGYGTAVTLTAAPTSGYVFSGWGGGCSGTGTCAVTMTSAQTVTATFTPQYTLSVAKSGSGTVTSSPSGISCGATCTATVNTGTSFMLTAMPASDYVFTGWSGGGCSGTGTCSVTLTSNTTVTATFTPQYTLTVGKSGLGTVTSSPPGINCGSTCSATVNSGTALTLTAMPNSGYVFTGWSGGGCSGTGTCSVTLTSNTTVTATFTPQYTLTVAKSGLGTVTSSPPAINCGSTCSATVNSGTALTLTAMPNSGYVFTGWSGGGCSGTGTCSVTVTANKTVTATFTAQYTLIVAKNGLGTVTSSPAGINCGATCAADFLSPTSVTLTAMPNSGWGFTGWSGTGIDCPGTGTCTVSMTQARTVTAAFLPLVTLTVSKTGTGFGTVTGPGISCGSSCIVTVPQGTQVTLDAGPDKANATLSTFTGWSLQACTGTTCSVTVDSNMTITASFHLSPNYMFVTSEMYTGDLGSIAGADMKCQTLADTAGVPGTFRAYLMSSSAAGVWTFANQRFPGVSGWMRVDGVAIADSIDQMHLGQLYNAPLKTEQDVDVTPTQATGTWTAMTRNGPIAGSGAGPCAAAGGNESWVSTNPNVLSTVGDATATGTAVVNISRRRCNERARLYCFGSDRAASSQ